MRLEGNSVIETNYYQYSLTFAASPNRLSGIEKTQKSAKKNLKSCNIYEILQSKSCHEFKMRLFA